MLSPLEQCSGRSTTSKRLQKIFYGWQWSPNRRHFACRLPFLVLWTLLAIILLYRSLSDNRSLTAIDAEKRVKARLVLQKDARVPLQRETRVFHHEDYNQLITEEYPSDLQKLPTDLKQKPIVIHDTLNEPQQTIPSSAIHQTSTVKKTNTDYNRRSKVFILLMQSASTYVFNKLRRSPLAAQQTVGDDPLKERFTLKDRSLRVPNHIRTVIDILVAHKINYAIESTRLGIPTSLMTDSDEFSVIVIDDFIKYTKLDRWMRDQLDRHCRKNQVGIVTFLDPDELQSDKRTMTTRTIGLTTEESMTDQFPLTLRPIGRRSCKKQSVCSHNYLLNDQSTILRILKRKRNFVVSPSPKEDPDISVPWIAMSSVHVTYEPILWTQFKHSDVHIGHRSMSRARRSTRDDNPAMSSMNNALTSSVAAAAKHKEADYDAYESSNEIYEAGGKSHSSNMEVTREYSRNQLQVAIEQNLSQSTKPGDRYNNGRTANHENSTMMHVESERYSYRSMGETSDNNATSNNNNNEEDYGTIEPELEVLSMFDRGLYDGIKRVIFGRANHHWLDRMILLDAIEHLSSGKILTPLERYIQIDIDDIFVGERGKRMNVSDVDALIGAQERFSHLIDGGFKFNLGFSGKYYRHGDEIENAGDEYLISKANHFNWFCHTWGHSKAHLMKDTAAIEMELRKNLQFAKQHGLPLIGHDGKPGREDDPALPETYAVAPHHSGVYPVHDELYEAWRKILNVRVTSTEEYPSLRPASNRKAFVHNAIKVLPRQTCGLYTHTIYRDRYPGGIDKLEGSINGGELFETILHNPVNIYMTHMSNYAHDRLALSTFLALIEFVQSYTSLQLKHAPSNNGQLGPNQLADYHFSLFPQELQPTWTNPCKDKRHLAIWAPEKHKYCSIEPQLLIVGPQKTGTTALYSFLRLHPEFRSSIQSETDFEEVQFFNDKHYSKGVDWYFSRFLPAEPGGVASALGTQNEEELYYFDKSATYFDDPKVAGRAVSLLPEAKIVILLVDPADRAYSWYQHARAHGDGVANSMSFEQIIMSSHVISSNEDTQYNISASTTVDQKAQNLRNRCLQPGYYSLHLARWLEHYQSRQIIIIDGQWFRQNPASVMNKLQLILRVQNRIDYDKLLVFSKQKGFYCHRDADRMEQIKCLGPGKGRKYLTMSPETRLYLNRHYLAYNKQLARLLSEIGQPLPVWLEEAISAGRRRYVAFS